MNRQTVITLVIGLLIVGGIVYVATRSSSEPQADVKSASISAVMTNNSQPTPTTAAQEAASTMTDQPTPTTTPSGLIIEDKTVGTGAEVKTGDTVSVHYIGTFTNGTKFDASRDRGQPFTFKVGAGNVIKGWDEGLVGMKVGGKRMLIVPSTLGYGSRDNGPIPANSTLQFEIDLISIP